MKKKWSINCSWVPSFQGIRWGGANWVEERINLLKAFCGAPYPPRNASSDLILSSTQFVPPYQISRWKWGIQEHLFLHFLNRWSLLIPIGHYVVACSVIAKIVVNTLSQRRVIEECYACIAIIWYQDHFQSERREFLHVTRRNEEKLGEY